MNINLVTMRYQAHGKYTGMHQISRFISYHRTFDLRIEYCHNFVCTFIKKVFNKILTNYRYLIDLRLIVYGWNKSEIFHLIEAEHQYNFFGKFKRRNKIICTFHQPIEYYEKKVPKQRMKRYKYIDHAIVLSKDLVPQMEKYIGKGKVSYFPLGVDSEYFQPNDSVTKDIDLLLVGNWLRDFETGARIIKEFETTPEFNIYILTQRHNHHFFTHLNNVQFINDLSDEELLAVYHRTKMLLLPLKGAVANTSLIETIAAGLCVCVSDIDTIFDYVDRKNVIVINPDNIEDTINNISALTSNEEELKNTNIRLKKDIESAFWINVSDRISNLYQQIALN